MRDLIDVNSMSSYLLNLVPAIAPKPLNGCGSNHNFKDMLLITIQMCIHYKVPAAFLKLLELNQLHLGQISTANFKQNFVESQF